MFYHAFAVVLQDSNVLLQDQNELADRPLASHSLVSLNAVIFDSLGIHSLWDN